MKLEKEGLIWKYRLLIKNVVLSILFLSCVKAEVIPPKTREGKHTFAYQLNDRFLGGEFNGESDYIYFQDSIIKINHQCANLRKHHPKEWKVTFILKYVPTQQTYELHDVSYHYSSYNNWRHYSILNDSWDNYFDVTYYNQNRKIISGEFALNLVQVDSLFDIDSTLVIQRIDSVSLKNGRFDLRFL